MIFLRTLSIVVIGHCLNVKWLKVQINKCKCAVCKHRVMDARGKLLSTKEARELHEVKDCRSFSV